MNQNWLSAILVSSLLLIGCNQEPNSKNQKASPKTSLTVATVNFPIRFFATRIGGEKIQLLQVVPKTRSNNKGWNPDTPTITSMQQADLILLNGAGFSKWMQTVSLPQGKIVNTSEQFEDKFIQLDSFVHRHGPKGGQSDKELVSTTWLDLSQAKQQATAIQLALCQQLPDASEEFEKNLFELASELDELDRQFEEAGKLLKDKPLIASAPIYQYLARRYGLDLISLQWNDQTELSKSQIKELESILESKPTGWMIWPNAPNDAIKKQLKEKFGIQIVVIDPADFARSDTDDWIQTMRQNLDALKSIQ